MIKLLITPLLILLVTVLYSQEDDIFSLIEDTIDVEEFYEETGMSYLFDDSYTRPVFQGGDKALNNYIKAHSKYPEMSLECQIQGIVYVQVEINKNGVITSSQLYRGVSRELDKEALRLVKGMGRWEPAMCGDKPISSNILIPIRFIISG